jgi:orotidine-5'-phosphate decarboxylase
MSKEKLIIALDVPGALEARAIVSELGGSVGAFKIGLQLFTAAGPVFVKEIVDLGHRVFLDLKFHDIPNTAAMAGVEAARLGVWMFNVHALGGGEMMRRTAEEVDSVCIKENLKRPLVIGVTVLTSSDRNTLSEVGIAADIDTEVLNLAKLASKYGLDGVVASPKESAAIRREFPDGGFVVVTPGIRPISATNDDQKRVTTPAAALASGADFMVIGRPVTQAADRRAAVEDILRDIETAELHLLKS